MTPPARITLGEADPLMTPEDVRGCNAWSQMHAGMPAPFLCTRAAGHGRDVEHVASGSPTGRSDAVAIGAWLEDGPLRILGIDAPIPDHLTARYGS